MNLQKKRKEETLKLFHHPQKNSEERKLKTKENREKGVVSKTCLFSSSTRTDAAFGGWCEACGAKLASLAFEKSNIKSEKIVSRQKFGAKKKKIRKKI